MADQLATGIQWVVDDSTGAITGYRRKINGVDTQFPYQPPVSGGGTGGLVRRLAASLKYTLANESMVLVGDSTGNQTDEWFYLFCVRALADLPANTYCAYRLFNDNLYSSGVGGYSAPVVLQAGAGEPFVTVGSDLRGWGISRSYTGAVGGGDLDIRVDVALADYTIGNQVLLANYGGVVGRNCFYMYLNSAGTPQLFWSTDGGTTTTTVSATASVTTVVADGARIRIRATLDVDNGAAGNTVTFYTSTDGVTWAALGSAVVTAGVTSVFNHASQPVEIGSRNAADGASTGGAIAGAIGTFYSAHLSTTINGANILPSNIRDWGPTNAMLGVKGGGPSLSIYNGSIPGRNVAWFTTGDRLERMVPRGYGTPVLLNTSHNEGVSYEPHIFAANIDTFVTAVNARVANAYYVSNTQNPQYPIRTAVQIDGQAARAAAWRQISAARQWPCIDAFADIDWTAAMVNSDGVHPLATGSTAWADVAYQALK